jgi:hypothetical protein
VSPPSETAVPPVPPPGGPRLSEAERQAAIETLDALKAVQSIATTGVSYRDYTSRMLDAKIQVEKFLQAQGGDLELKSRVQNAMTLYLLAGAAWNARIQGNAPALEAIGTQPALQLCPEIQPVLDLPPPLDIEGSAALKRGVNVASNLDILWGCASNNITETGQVLKALSSGG